MRERLKSKLHRARVTRTDLDYDGSIAIDRALLAAADIDEYEQVQVVNVTNGERFWTYAIEGGRDEVSVNGAAAHLTEPGDVVIVMAFGVYDDDHAPAPTVVLLDEDNHIVDFY